jgi:3-oxoacyl-[acyl-carrier-protein] synthase II
MAPPREVVITGVGVASPIGIGRQAFWHSLREGRSGIRPFADGQAVQESLRFGGVVPDFDPKQYVTPRKSLKVMSRDIQLGFTAAQLACDDAGLVEGAVDPDRFGVVFGADMIYCDPTELTDAFRSCLRDGAFDFAAWGQHALRQMYPLWLLKYLPNMPACHIAIARDARGPNNSLTLGDVSSLTALAEAVRVIERSLADVVISGGSGSRIHPMVLIFKQDDERSRRAHDPAAASRPFDADRDGLVYGEGAAALVLESRQSAEARGAKVLARVLGYANTFEPRVGTNPLEGLAIRSSIAGALRSAGLQPGDIGHVNAHGASTIRQDQLEAQAIRDLLGDVPVTAPKSYFGNLGAAGGAVELAASVLALEHQQIPPTLNYHRPDPLCPINVIHGQPAPLGPPTVLALSQASTGQAAAVVLAGG